MVCEQQQIDVMLLYRHNCFKCRILSFFVVLISLGAIRRIPHDSVEALRLQGGTPMARIKASVIYHGIVYGGTKMLFIVLAETGKHWRRILWLLVLKKINGSY